MFPSIALHRNEHHIIHTDIKPSRILVDYEVLKGCLYTNKVQLGGVENACQLKHAQDRVNMRNSLDRWNWAWMSPEYHTIGIIGLPSDLFSFGLTSIYAVTALDYMLTAFNMGKEMGRNSDHPSLWAVRFMMTSFGNCDSVKGLIDYVSWGEEEIQNNPTLRKIREMADIVGSEWGLFRNAKDPDNDRGHFKDFVFKLMDMDPAKRITAREALNHAWFDDVKYLHFDSIENSIDEGSEKASASLKNVVTWANYKQLC